MLNTTNTWIKVCKLTDLPTNKAVDLQIANQRLIITRCTDDSAQIYQGFCTHMLFPLAGSKVENCELTCGLHKSKFDVRNGLVESWADQPSAVGSALGDLQTQKALRAYETKIEDGTLFISWMAESPESIAVRVKL